VVEGRIVIIPFLQGKLNFDGTVTEPDIEAILEKWLERHTEFRFLEVAERKPEWRAEVPLFIAKIKDIFEPWQIAEFFETPRRLGALGHTADEEGHKVHRSQVDESENLREDARNLMLFEQAREWLLEDKE
jgi:hypothetical protein